MSFSSSVKAAVTGDAAVGTLYIALIAAILGDLIPTIADSGVLLTQQKLNDELRTGQITPRQYWFRYLFAYYLYNPIFWALLLVITVHIAGGARHKFNIVLAVIASGILIFVVQRNIAKDKQQLQAEGVLPQVPA